MSTQLKLRRGTTAQHSTFIGAEGEITVDTTKDTVVVHDGTTAGGIPLAKESALSGYVSTSGGVITANTSTDALRITQTGVGNALLVEDDTNPDSTPFVVTNSGNVGIGVIPENTLEVSIPSGSTIARIRSAAGISFLDLSRASNTVAAPTVVANNDVLGRVRWRGYDGSAFLNAASVESQVDGTPGTNDMPGRLVFSTTADGASSTTERMRIDNAGRVGIGGTANAYDKFYIGGTLPSGSNVSRAVEVTATGPSASTGEITGFVTQLTTEAAAFTCTNIRHFASAQNTLGAGSSVTNQYGFRAESSLTGATNNYGFHSNIASGTGRYNFYAAGSADNYFAGNVGIGDAAPADRLSIYTNSATNTFTKVANTAGSMYYGVYSTGVGTVGTTSNTSFLVLTNNTERMRIDSSGNVIQSAPTTAPTLSTNGTMVFNLTSNTNLRVSVRGSDGVTRTANITLA